MSNIAKDRSKGLPFLSNVLTFLYQRNDNIFMVKKKKLIELFSLFKEKKKKDSNYAWFAKQGWQLIHYSTSLFMGDQS